MTNHMRNRNRPFEASRRLVAAIDRDAAVDVQAQAACALRGQRDALTRRLRAKLAKAKRLARWRGERAVKRLAAYDYALYTQGEQHA